MVKLHYILFGFERSGIPQFLDNTLYFKLAKRVFFLKISKIALGPMI